MPSPASSPVSRRHFLGAAGATLAAAALPRASFAAEPAAATPPAPRNGFAYRFGIGDIEAWSISDGHMLFREGLNLMWPEADRAAMREDLVAHGERTDAIPLYVNILLLKLGNEYAIFDSGFGPRPNNANIGWVAAALKDIGVAPEKITHAFLSHAHADHIGGFVTGNQIVFPNAALHVMQDEVDFWRSPSPDFSKSKRAKGPLPGMIKDARDKFDVLQPNLQLHRDGDAVLGGAITFEAAPGHTSGHVVFRIKSGSESLVHYMDVAHHHTLMFANPGWGIAFDHDPELAIKTRRELWARLAGTHQRAYGFHVPWPGLGRIAAHGAGYVWEQERWSWGS